MRYAGLGVQLAVSLLVFVLAGQWLDKRLGNTGIVTMVAAFVGFGGTMYSLIRALNRQDAGGQDAVGKDGGGQDGGDKDGGGE
jgi:putative F0F1-ATPase subunit (Ca2+/Mg2+ transporter)